MNRQICIAILLAASAMPAIAQESPRTLSAVEVRGGVLYVTECSHRALPSQREVGEWTGQHNFSQVYDARERLMSDIGRECRRPGISRVQVIRGDGESREATRFVAVALPGGN